MREKGETMDNNNEKSAVERLAELDRGNFCIASVAGFLTPPTLWAVVFIASDKSYKSHS